MIENSGGRLSESEDVMSNDLRELLSRADTVGRGDHTLVIHYPRPTDRDDAYRLLLDRDYTVEDGDEVNDVFRVKAI